MVANRPVLALRPTATAVEVALHQTDRSMAVSYAKDLCCADKIERGEVFEVATKILAFIEDGPEAVQEEIDWREEKEEG